MLWVCLSSYLGGLLFISLRFGAVMEDFELRDALQKVLATKDFGGFRLGSEMDLQSGSSPQQTPAH
jgi:hypothetical protein